MDTHDSSLCTGHDIGSYKNVVKNAFAMLYNIHQLVMQPGHIISPVPGIIVFQVIATSYTLPEATQPGGIHPLALFLSLASSMRSSHGTMSSKNTACLEVAEVSAHLALAMLWPHPLGTCALWCLHDLHTSHLGLVDLQATWVFAYPPFCGSLGVSFRKSICSFKVGSSP